MIMPHKGGPGEYNCVRSPAPDPHVLGSTTMWVSPGLGLPISLLGLAAQVPLESTVQHPAPDMVASYGVKDFNFTDETNVFSPVDLVKLARPGTGTANGPGDLFIVTVSKYSLEDKK